MKKAINKIINTEGFLKQKLERILTDKEPSYQSSNKAPSYTPNQDFERIEAEGFVIKVEASNDQCIDHTKSYYVKSQNQTNKRSMQININTVSTKKTSTDFDDNLDKYITENILKGVGIEEILDHKAEMLSIKEVEEK